MNNLGGLFQVLYSPWVTEKATLCMSQGNQVIFKVDPNANKRQIKAAVEKMFQVDVLAVQTVSMQGKQKRVGRVAGQRKDWKKAIVRLKSGQSIDFYEKA
ncbi:MAG: 50S ribosomal protein L23 [Magnetococcales bacterium]|nr:50S ribosomal protein L23 [Magnetococcales bacterium]MBF0582797.1 50S ribosomal protein L23 [Magnetococcales bacterium]